MINKFKVQQYCCEDISKIENYEEAVNSPEPWVCHHRMELIETGAVIDNTQQDLIGWGIYYDRPADELILLTKADHNILHHKGKKRPPRSGEYKRKISKARKGLKFSEEWKRKISEAKKGKPYLSKYKHWKLIDGKRVYY